MLRTKLSFLFLALAVLASCGLFKKKQNAWEDDWTTAVDTAVASDYEAEPAAPTHPSETRVADLLHTRIDIKPDWNKQQVPGTAVLQLKPYSRPIDSLILDAKSMEIQEVNLSGNTKTPLQYSYDGKKLRIRLNKSYTRSETFKVEIRYIAKPEEVASDGGHAITHDKGFYFIDPLDTIANKPRQIWTQGETQANSCWFPTIDIPNERQTHDIYVTVDKKYKTLSNGELIVSNFNNDGTRTDHWKMSLPHAPYLTMLAVGEFAVVQDDWRDTVELEYWLDPEFKPYAKLIFGNTPEMLEFYSTRLGVNYPWPNFKQVVVHDFVSGAMENTTAVVHYGKLQHDARAHLDETYEDIIAHELFHHWFGDLVTCESWSNVPLNESFATYGQYLWNEHKYGLMYADYKQNSDREQYKGTSYAKELPLIRYQYNSRDELFDGLSYQKGGLILHMLRNYLGDEIFFESLKLYLNQNKFKTVEVAQLRLAFEEVSGEDLNWFFDQWFFKPSHPNITASWGYAPDEKLFTMSYMQYTDDQAGGSWKIPLEAAIYTADTVIRVPVILQDYYATVQFQLDSEPVLVMPDAKQVYLDRIAVEKSEDMWKEQWARATRYQDFREVLDWVESSLNVAMEAANENTTPTIRMNVTQEDLVRKALEHPFFGIRERGLEVLSMVDSVQQVNFSNKLLDLSTRDSSSKVRSLALTMMQRYKMPSYETATRIALNDSSYNVFASALLGLQTFDSTLALQIARNNMNSQSSEIISTVVQILAQSGEKSDLPYLLEQTRDIENGALNAFTIGTFLERYGEEEAAQALPYMKAVVQQPHAPWFYGMLINYSNQRVIERLTKLKAEYEKSGRQSSVERTDAVLKDYIEFSESIRQSLEVQLQNHK